MAALKESVKKRIKRIKLLVMDCDGVLTDGGIIYDCEGREIKVFNVRDGHGIKLLKRAGLDCAVITARSSEALKKRCAELSITMLYQGALDKRAAYEDILARTGFRAEETAFVGDDLVDIPVMRRAGFAVSVRDGVKEVKKAAHYRTECCGGRGAIREVIEILLKTQGKWGDILKGYMK
ncbi:MAG: HAD-IIIA family hydrolase [Thermodesulfobacteriota bacterium]